MFMYVRLNCVITWCILNVYVCMLDVYACMHVCDVLTIIWTPQIEGWRHWRQCTRGCMYRLHRCMYRWHYVRHGPAVAVVFCVIMLHELSILLLRHLRCLWLRHTWLLLRHNWWLLGQRWLSLQHWCVLRWHSWLLLHHRRILLRHCGILLRHHWARNGSHGLSVEIQGRRRLQHYTWL